MGWLGIFQSNRVFVGKKNYFITTGTFLRNICWTKLLQKSYLNSLWASYPSPQTPYHSKTLDGRSSSQQSRKLLWFVYSGKSWWQCLLSSPNTELLWNPISVIPSLLSTRAPPQVMAKVTLNTFFFFFFFLVCVCVEGGGEMGRAFHYSCEALHKVSIFIHKEQSCQSFRKTNCKQTMQSELPQTLLSDLATYQNEQAWPCRPLMGAVIRFLWLTEFYCWLPHNQGFGWSVLTPQ